MLGWLATPWRPTLPPGALRRPAPRIREQYLEECRGNHWLFPGRRRRIASVLPSMARPSAAAIGALKAPPAS